MPEHLLAAPASFGAKQSLHRIGLAATLACVWGTSAWASDLDIVGVSRLLAMEPSLTGAGVRVGQAEADYGATTYEFEVDPTAAGQPAGLFTYTDQNGNVSNTFNATAASWHAGAVGAIFYGPVGTGVAGGVSHVDNYSADYFFDDIVFWGVRIPDAVVNQSFEFTPQANNTVNLINQQSSDTEYDNYIDQYGTIVVTGVGNSGFPFAPATSYNGISVGVDDGSTSVGPTLDGRAAPDITAPGLYTSFSTPLVSGSAALLVQAGRRGDGGTSPQTEAAAVDPRTIKALLMNGADKQAVTFNRTPTSPLDPTNGSGLLNVYNSYEQLVAGEFPASSVLNTSSVGGAHPADMASAAINTSAGWNFATLSSSASSDAYANYIFVPPIGVTSYTLTATLVWERQYNNTPSVPMGINNLDLYLYDTTTNTLVDSSISKVDNVQDVYDQNLAPGDRYDLEVLKNGGVAGLTPGVVSDTETYALAFNLAAVQSVWNVSGGGSALSASNWAGGLPDLATDTASFTGAITSPATVNFPSNWVVGNINFDNSHSYTIASATGSPLIIDNGGSSTTGIITVAGGNHSISAPLQLNSNLEVILANAADSLNISGNLGDNPAASGAGLSVGGEGTLYLSGTNTYRSGTTINSGALVIDSTGGLPAGGGVVNNSVLSVQAGTSQAPVTVGQISGVGSLSIGGAAPAYLELDSGSGLSYVSSMTLGAGSTLNITNNGVAFNYGSGADPVAMIVNALTAGYNGNKWSGPGITSSTAAINPGRFAIGYADGNVDTGTPAKANQVLVQYTLAGDASLRGSVGVSDLLIVVQNFNTTGKDWAHGNFTYSSVGAVGVADLLLVSQNFNRSMTLSEQPQTLTLASMGESAVGTAVMPEPVAGGLLAIAPFLLTRRRRQINN